MSIKLSVFEPSENIIFRFFGFLISPLKNLILFVYAYDGSHVNFEYLVHFVGPQFSFAELLPLVFVLYAEDVLINQLTDGFVVGV